MTRAPAHAIVPGHERGEADRRRGGGHAARGDQARAAHPRAAREPDGEAGGRLERPAPRDGAGGARTRRHHPGRRPVGGLRPLEPQLARSGVHASLRGLPHHHLCRRRRGAVAPPGRVRGHSPGRRTRPRRHELRVRRRAGCVPPADPGRARRGRAADRGLQLLALPGGAQPPADLVHRRDPLRADGRQRGEPRAREHPGQSDLRLRQHRDRRAAVGGRPRRPVRRRAGRRPRRGRRADRGGDRAPPGELGRRPAGDRRGHRAPGR